MREKIFVVLITLVMTSTAITIPRDIKVIATVDYGNPDIDNEYILSKTENLSKIVFESEDYWNWGRFFGTDGERYAAFKIEDWMEEDIGLDCVHLETIDSTWDSEYSKGKPYKSLYIGNLNKARNMSEKFYLNISVYENSLGLILIDYKNLTMGECYPYFQHSRLDWKRASCMALVVENFSKILPVTQMELCDRHYLNYEEITNRAKYLDMLIRYVGYIVIDNSTDSFFQDPPVFDQNHWLGLFESQGFYVNGSVGSWIRGYVHNMYHVVVKYGTYWEYEDVISYNVIGQINGIDPDPKNISIVCAHYDAMPGQGTIDEGAETALVLGIAKYIKDHELESDLKHTVKFIAFGAEEVGIRGAKDYIVKHVINNENENVSYVINPGNFGSYERNATYNGEEVIMSFEMASDMPWLSQMAKDIADALQYTQQTTETGDYPITVITRDELRAEDSMCFGEQCMDYYSDGCIQFSRAPNEGRHRDGEDHTTGDSFDTIDQDTFNLECEVVVSVALHLLLNLDYQYENCSFTPVDLDGDGYNDSVNITVNMSTNNNATLLGKSLGGLYNSTTGSLSCHNVEDTSLIPLNKGNITTVNQTLTLMPDKTAGYYKANLSLFDPLGDLHEECNQTFYLYPINKPFADFGIAQTGSKTFHFTDSSIPSPNADNISSWNWSFGDGNYSNLTNPSHTYTYEDSYDVTLTVVDDQNLSDNVTQPISATNDIPSASYTMSTNVERVNIAITFTSTSSDEGSISNAKWYFGDGTTGSGNNVQHSYSSSDVYTVTLEVTDNDGCVNTTSDVVYIAGALVDDSYPGDNPSEKKWDTIQEGINDVRDNELVYVFSGEYIGSVTVNKPISIYGEEGGNAFINNTFSSAIGVSVVSDSTVVDGFTIENNNNIGISINGLNNTIISNCNILNTTTGIKIENNAEGNMIMHCNFTNNTYGVYITSSDYNIVGSIGDTEQPVVTDCMFLLNDYGVYLENADYNYIVGCTINATGISDPRLPPPYSWGICLDNADNNTIALCDVFSASQYGMYLSGSINNSISSCIVRENSRGIYLSGSSYNSIIGNNISDSSYAGVSIVTMSSTGNSVFWNDFIRNGIITQVQAEDFGTGNNWNAPENTTYLYNGSGEGNNWDDYTGTDSDGDGIGDTSYSIAGTANADDDFPVMEEYGWMYKWF